MTFLDITPEGAMVVAVGVVFLLAVVYVWTRR